MDRRDTRARWLAWWALVSAVVLVPLANSVFTMPFTGRTLLFDQYDIPKVFMLRVCLLIACAAWGWDVLGGGWGVRRTPVDWAVMAVLAWVGLTTATSISPATSVFGLYHREEGLLVWIGYALLFFITVQLADSGRRIRQLAEALALTSLPIALFGIAQFAGWDPLPLIEYGYEGRAFATFGNPEPLGNFLMFSLPVSAALLLAEKDFRRRLLWWAVFAANGLCLMATFTRAAWAGGVVALAVLAAAVWLRRAYVRQAVDRWAAGAVATVTVAAVALSSGGGDAVTSVPDRLLSLLQFREGSGRTRLDLWGSTLDAIADRPVLGFGPDTYELFFPAYRSAEYFRYAEFLSWADNAHSYPLHLASTLGIPGALLVLGFFSAVMWWFARGQVGRERIASEGMLVVAGFGAGLAGWLVALLAGISTAGTSFVAWIAAGVVMAPLATQAAWKSVPAWQGARVAVAGVCAALVVASAIPVIADRHELASQRYSAGDYRLATAEKAVQLAPYNDAYRRQAYLVGSELARQDIEGARMAGGAVSARDKAALDAALAEMDAAIVSSPWQFRHYEFAAMAYNYAGERLGDEYSRRAFEVTEQALERFPNTPTLLYERARAEIALGQPAEAETDLVSALALDPRLSDATLLLASSIEARGDRAAALAALREYAEFAMDREAVRRAMEALEGE